MRLLRYVVLAAAVSACAEAAPPPPNPLNSPDPPAATSAPSASTKAAAAKPPEATPPILVTVTHVVADDAWKATWSFTEPTHGMIFDRRRPLFRSKSWKPEPEIRWVTEGEHELLKSVDGKPRTTFTVTFPTDDSNKERAPPLHVAFTDGSRLLFTAHLGAHALACAEPKCDRRGLGDQRMWVFRSDADRSLRVLEQAAQGELTWKEPAGDLRGTYLYSGKLAPESSSGAAMIVDPGLPPWLRTSTARVVPQLLSLYQEKTGLELDFRPLLLLSQGKPAAPGDGFRGRALPGLLQLEAVGSAWQTESDGTRSRWFEFLAHEAFHFYNSQLARRSGKVEDEWLSEGSSMYVAGLALVHTGLLDRAGAEERLVRAANDCAATLKTGLRREASEPSFYSCGEIVQLLVDRDLASAGGVWALYAELFGRARARGSYSTDDFLDVLAARAKPAVVADVKSILTTGLGAEPDVTMQRLLTGAGLSTALEPLPPPGPKPRPPGPRRLRLAPKR